MFENPVDSIDQLDVDEFAALSSAVNWDSWDDYEDFYEEKPPIWRGEKRGQTQNIKI